jgi:hypothetical protein
MSKQDSLPSETILDNSSEHAWTNGVQVDRMRDMGNLEVRTQNSLYEITIIDGHSVEVDEVGVMVAWLVSAENSFTAGEG